MSPLTVAKLALAVVGMLLFAYGIRTDSQSVRWVGIALVAAAAVLRFVKARPGSGGTTGA